MTSDEADHSRGRLSRLFDSATFARAFALTVFGAVFSGFAIERMAGLVTYVTIVVGLCAVGVGILISRRREITLLGLAPITLVIFLLWALASVFWSSDAIRSFVSWLPLVSIAFLAVVLGHIRDTLQTVRALADVLRVLLAVSLGLEVLSGILIDMPLTFLGVQGNLAQFGPIQGIFGSRNMLGFVAILALITFLVEYRTQSVSPGVSLGSVILGGVLAALSDSPTVVALAVGTALASGALVWVRHTRPERRRTLQGALGAVVVLGIIIGYSFRHTIIGLLGARTDFSMRVNLWNLMIDYVRFHPVEGWGWHGPWTRELPFTVLNYILGTSHASGLNAYFDVLLQLGWVGLLLFVSLAGVALVRAWLDASERRSVIYAWTPLILVALLIDSMFESFTLSGIGWMMLALCAVRAGKSRSWRERIRGGEPVGPVSEALPREG